MELLRGDRDVVRIGHRGAAALAPENSLAAIEAAAAPGVDAVELDVGRGLDGRLVLAHGPAVPPDAPALEAGLALAARLGVAAQMDVKRSGVEEGVVEALRRNGLLDRSFVSSFSLRTLRAFWAVVTPRAIEVCHRAGVAVYVWTVNEPALAKTLVDCGIDGIITDDPRLVARLLPEGIRPTS